jgi:hypothetical protein
MALAGTECFLFFFFLFFFLILQTCVIFIISFLYVFWCFCIESKILLEKCEPDTTNQASGPNIMIFS